MDKYTPVEWLADAGAALATATERLFGSRERAAAVTRAVHPLSAFAHARALERRLAQHVSPRETDAALVRIEAWKAARHRHHVAFRREGRRLVVSVPRMPLGDRHWILGARIPVLVHLLTAANTVSDAIADISDGEDSGPGLISFCSADARSILVPDPEYYTSAGYARIRAATTHAPSWGERADALLWRGTTTGYARISSEILSPDDTTLIQRVRMCLLLRDEPGVDAKLVGITQSPAPQRDEARLRAAGIMGEYRSSEDWLRIKYAIDIDGNTNAWANCYTRLLMGCCVIKVASPAGYRQWFYEELKPWVHYVPVSADLSDLVDRIHWCRTHDRACADIAAAGQAFAMQRTLATECADAVSRLEVAARAGLLAVEAPASAVNRGTGGIPD